MPRRGENIRKRKDGRWEARYLVASDSRAAPKYRSVYGRTYREVKQKRELLRQSAQTPPTNRTCLFRDILTLWQDANRVRLKASSISRYQHLIDTHILPELGDLPTSRLSAAVINSFLSQKLSGGRTDGAGGLSAAYVRSIALVIESALRTGAAQGLCPPINAPITKPSLQKQELVVLDPKEQGALEAVLLTQTDATRLLVFITLYTGLRIGEACALRWEDIDLKSRVLHVRRTVSRLWEHDGTRKHSVLVTGPPKTPSSLRTVPLCSKLFHILLSYPERGPEGCIAAPGADFTSPRTFEYRYKTLLRKTGLRTVRFHSLRHTFATRCIEAGVDVKSLSEILGHANVSVTLNTYVHSSMELKRIQLEKLVL